MVSAAYSEPVFVARNVSKAFSGRKVLRDVCFDVLPGEVHGLLGQNGSGKSTLVKIISGFHRPDDGASLLLQGSPISLPMVAGDARKLGMSFVHQDLGLIESATVLENLRVGRYETRFGWRIPWREERRHVSLALSRFGLALDPNQMVSALGEVDRAMIAIVRAFEELTHTDRGLLVLDEPTASLPYDGVDQLFTAIRQVASAGVGIVFVTHRLEEVWAITDRVSVLRDGVLVKTTATASLTEEALVESILGFSLGELYPTQHQWDAESILDVRNVSGSRVHGFSLDVRRGEIVGLTGLVGMGWERVPYLLFGAETAHTGSITVDGRTQDLRSFSPRLAIRSGLALLPADRRRDGAVAAATVAENMTLNAMASYFVRGVLRRQREERNVRTLMQKFLVQPPDPTLRFAVFSGGNQQKALIGKWFATTPRVLLMHEPTQGVDVGARKEIFRHIRDAADGGMSVVIASSEYEDLAHLCHRVIVFRDGIASVQLEGANLSHDRILEKCFAR